MTTREIHTEDGTVWTLSPATGTRAERQDDTVPVVATPAGGETSVRLTLAADWLDQTDDAIAEAIQAERD